MYCEKRGRPMRLPPFGATPILARAARLWLGVLACAVGLLLAVPASADPVVALSEGERAYLEAHPTVRMGADAAWPPFDFVDGEGRHCGINADYVALVAKKLGCHIEVVCGQWLEIQERCRRGEIDGLLGPSRNPDRERWLLFTRSYLASPHVILTRESDRVIRSVHDLAGRRVAHNQGDGIVVLLREQASAAQLLPFPSCGEALAAVSSGQAEAAVLTMAQAGHDIEKNLITNLKVQKVLGVLDDSRLHLAVRSDRSVLRDLLQKGLDAITDEEHRVIRRRWIPLMAQTDGKQEFGLTSTEKAWLQAHRNLRLGFDPAWAPIEYRDTEGVHRGVAAEYLRKIADALAIRFDPGQARTWSATMEAAARGEVDVLSALMVTPEREKYLVFTRPFFQTSMVIATRRESATANRLEELAGRRVGVVQGYAVQSLLARDFPDVTVVPVRDNEEGLLALARGDLDAYIDAIPSITCAVQKLVLGDVIAVTGVTPYPYAVSIGVRKDLAPLRDIIDRFLETIPASERMTIERLCFEQAARPDSGQFWRQVGRWVAVFLVIGMFFVGVILWWNRRLAREVRVRLAVESELMREQEKTEAASRAKSEFVARVSHDIRTPMNAILGFAEVLARRPMTTDQRAAVEAILDSSKVMIALVNDLLDLAKIEEGRLEICPVVVDLPELASGICTMYRGLAESKRLALIVAVTPTVPRYVSIDEIRLRQILANLVNNAIKFTDRGRVEVALDAVVLGDTADLTIRVIDTGVGIPSAHLASIFESFAQQPGQSRRYGGTGLGLAISRQLATLMQGTLQVESEQGKGTVFTLRLERVPVSSSPPRRANVVESEERFQPASVLIVDDTESNRQLVREMLRVHPFRIEEAADGVEALERARRHRPDVMILDVEMPRMDGCAVVHQVRQDASLATVPIILLTASLLQNGDPFVLQNVVRVLRKPVTSGDLNEALALVLARAEGGGALRHPVPVSPPVPIPAVALQPGGEGRPIVLVVDDQPVIRRLLGEYLNTVGCTMLEAASGGQALDRMQGTVPTLVITDFNMPDMTGVALRERMRGDSRLAAVPVVFLSGADLPVELAGTAICLRKPVSIAELTAALRQVVPGLAPTR